MRLLKKNCVSLRACSRFLEPAMDTTAQFFLPIKLICVSILDVKDYVPPFLNLKQNLSALHSLMTVVPCDEMQKFYRFIELPLSVILYDFNFFRYFVQILLRYYVTLFIYLFNLFFNWIRLNFSFFFVPMILGKKMY